MNRNRSFPIGPRSQGKRVQSKVILLVVDGVSEVEYFNYFKNRNPHLKIIPKDTGETSYERIMNKCTGYMSEHRVSISSGDKVAIVTDVDKHLTKDIIDFERKCKIKSIDLFISNPSFEVWLLLHFKNLGRPYTQEELEEDISHALRKKYKKSEGIDPNDHLIDMAIKRSVSMIDDFEVRNEECLKKNSSSTLHFLVRDIL